MDLFDYDNRGIDEMAKSIEEKIEDKVKELLKNNKTEFFSKTDTINEDIDNALAIYPSKSGEKGGNKPDVKMFIRTSKLRNIPVMIEVKGQKGDFRKNQEKRKDTLWMVDKDGTPMYKYIKKYAVNGAVHYAKAILEKSKNYREVVAVGINGYDEGGQRLYEVAICYVAKANGNIPQVIFTTTEAGEKELNISWLYKNNWDKFVQKIDDAQKSPEERDKLIHEAEHVIDDSLRALNQYMHEEDPEKGLNIAVGQRIYLVAGMLMAGLGVKGEVSPLTPEELKGNSGTNSHDGQIILSRIDDFLKEKDLPEDKRTMTFSLLQQVFLDKTLYEAVNGVSKLRNLYDKVYEKILPFFDTENQNHIDFTGRLFNVLTEWVDIPDGQKNDVVLTPRYVTNLMAQLCKVNKDSYVWDYAAGTAGFLVSAMHLMLADAEKITDINKREQKKKQIRTEQLLGIEKRGDIYLLAVLNMILMRDGSANLIHADSTKFDGNYAQGIHKNEPFKANVFLLNPPYSAEGKGCVFVELALSKMDHGRAAVLIQENAGSGNGMPYTKRILEHNTLLASIHMSDIFCGKANVQVGIYVFEIGVPHDVNKDVIFIDMGEDGYKRQNRKKSSIDVNLRDDGTAKDRYTEVVDIINGNHKRTDYYKEDEQVFRGTITLEGNDWTVNQHKKYDVVPTEADFRHTVEEYLAWKLGTVVRQQGGSDGLGK